MAGPSLRTGCQLVPSGLGRVDASVLPAGALLGPTPATILVDSGRMEGFPAVWVAGSVRRENRSPWFHIRFGSGDMSGSEGLRLCFCLCTFSIKEKETDLVFFKD